MNCWGQKSDWGQPSRVAIRPTSAPWCPSCRRAARRVCDDSLGRFRDAMWQQATSGMERQFRKRSKGPSIWLASGLGWWWKILSSAIGIQLNARNFGCQDIPRNNNTASHNDYNRHNCSLWARLPTMGGNWEEEEEEKTSRCARHHGSIPCNLHPETIYVNIPAATLNAATTTGNRFLIYIHPHV